jgi:hypothetical protein
MKEGNKESLFINSPSNAANASDFVTESRLTSTALSQVNTMLLYLRVLNGTFSTPDEEEEGVDEDDDKATDECEEDEVESNSKSSMKSSSRLSLQASPPPASIGLFKWFKWFKWFKRPKFAPSPLLPWLLADIFALLLLAVLVTCLFRSA